MLRWEKKKFWVMAAFCFLSSVSLSDHSGAGPLTPIALEAKELLEVKIHRLILDPSSGQPVVFLTEPREERALLVWIGPCEANALNSELEGTHFPRPMTHDLTVRILQELRGKIQRVVITHSKEGTYFATLVVEREGRVIEIDARPSDSMILAQKVKAPIFVSRGLFAQASVLLKGEREVEERYGITVQELTPSLAQSFSFKSARGVLIADVRGGSDAEKDSLQRGDIFVEVGGEPVGDVKALRATFARGRGGIKAKIFRKGEVFPLTLNLK